MTTERILLLVCHTALIIFGIIFLLIFILLKVTDKIQSFKDYLVAFVTLLGAPLILCSFYLIPISEELKTGIVIGILFMGLPLALSICYLIGKVIDARKIQARYENLI